MIRPREARRELVGEPTDEECFAYLLAHLDSRPRPPRFYAYIGCLVTAGWSAGEIAHVLTEAQEVLA